MRTSIKIEFLWQLRLQESDLDELGRLKIGLIESLKGDVDYVNELEDMIKDVEAEIYKQELHAAQEDAEDYCRKCGRKKYKHLLDVSYHNGDISCPKCSWGHQ